MDESNTGTKDPIEVAEITPDANVAPQPPAPNREVMVDRSGADKPQPKTVELSQETFEELMKSVAELKTLQDAMLAVEDKNKVIEIDRLRNNNQLVKRVKLREVNGLLVIGWRTVKNEVYMQDGRLIEDQVIEVWFEGGEKKEIRLREWAAMPVYKPFEVIKESRDTTGATYFTVKKDDGQELEIATSFVN